jgi:hypothetical protein
MTPTLKYLVRRRGAINDNDTEDLSLKKKMARWKRRAREENKAESKQKEACTT